MSLPPRKITPVTPHQHQTKPRQLLNTHKNTAVLQKNTTLKTTLKYRSVHVKRVNELNKRK